MKTEKQRCGQGPARVPEPLQEQAEQEQDDGEMEKDAHQVKSPGPGAGNQVVQMKGPERQRTAAVLFQESPVVETPGHQGALQDQRVIVEVEGRREGVEIDGAGDQHECRRRQSQGAWRIHEPHIMDRIGICPTWCMVLFLHGKLSGPPKKADLLFPLFIVDPQPASGKPPLPRNLIRNSQI